MASNPEPPGCRNAAISVGPLVGVALVFMAIGLTLVNDSTCSGGCETLALTLTFAGLPVSGVFAFFLGDLVVAWPLDITFWVVAGFLLARYCSNRDRNVLGGVLMAVILAFGYGLVLSSQLEIAIS